MKRYSETELKQKLAAYPAWAVDEESGKLVAGFEFDNFTQALDFLFALGELAQKLDHYPDLLLHDQKFVTVFTSTHSVKGISDRDFELVAAIETELAQ